MIKWLRSRKTLTERVAALEKELAVKEEQVQNLRAHLMELRVSNESPRKGAIGWMVSAFVPDNAVKKLVAQPGLIPEYVRLVAEALVTSAIRQILRIAPCGHVQALIFEPVKDVKQQVIRTRPWFQIETERAAALDFKAAQLLAEESERRRRMVW